MVGTNCHDQCVQADGGIMYNIIMKDQVTEQ